MASTLITTNADALKRAAREFSKQSGGLTPNGALNILAGAITGPGKNWGMITGAPSGHYVQPGLQGAPKQDVPFILQIEGRPPMAFASREQALEAFQILAQHAINRDDACSGLSATGSASLQHVYQRDLQVHLTEFAVSSVKAMAPLHETPFTPLSQEVVDRLRSLVSQGRSMLICGATTVGTDTLLEELARSIPHGKKVVSIEGMDRLSLSHQIHLPLSVKPLHPEWPSQFMHHVYGALRMAPDWIVTEELRERESASAWLDATATGHHTLTTMHAAGTQAALGRLEDMLSDYGATSRESARRKIGKGTDVIIYLSHILGIPTRHIEAIEVRGYEDGAYDIAPIAL